MTRQKRHLNFRADPEDIEKLKKLAERDNTPVSALFSRVLKSYVEWEYIASAVGMITVQKDFIMGILNFIEDKDLTELAIQAADRFMDKLLMITGDNELDSFLHLTRERVQKSGFKLTESEESGEMLLTIQHNMGHKWSVFSSAFHKRVLENLRCHADTRIRDNLWMVRIRQETSKIMGR